MQSPNDLLNSVQLTITLRDYYYGGIEYNKILYRGKGRRKIVEVMV
jgi:hypothetical protein